MVQVIIKSFDILELVARRSGQAVSLTDISQELDLKQATAANIIKTLVNRGYLEHIGKKKGYKLGPAAFGLTNEVAYEQGLINASRHVMEALSARFNESCLLGVIRNHKRLILHIVNSNHEIQVQVRSERNVYETASGRLLLAYLSEKQLEQFLQQNGFPDKNLWPNADSLEGLKSELRDIKEKGIAITHVKDKDYKGFAVPIYDNNVVVAGLSIFVPEYRCSAKREAEIIDAMNEATKQIGNWVR